MVFGVRDVYSHIKGRSLGWGVLTKTSSNRLNQMWYRASCEIGLTYLFADLAPRRNWNVIAPIYYRSIVGGRTPIEAIVGLIIETAVLVIAMKVVAEHHVSRRLSHRRDCLHPLVRALQGAEAKHGCARLPTSHKLLSRAAGRVGIWFHSLFGKIFSQDNFVGTLSGLVGVYLVTGCQTCFT